MSRRALLGGVAAGAAVAITTSGCGRRDEPPQRPEGVPLSQFDAKSTAAEVVAPLDLSGRTYLITGGTSGLGLETARALAGQGADVLLTGRTADRARQAAQTVGGRCTGLELELTSPDSIIDCARQVEGLGVAIDGLICNAGIMRLGERRVIAGIEEHLAVNHLGHFLLVNRLLARVRAAPQGRVVVVASSAWKWAPPAGIEFDNLDGSREYTANKAYGQSKLANALFSLELARRLASTTATSNAVNPGPVDTDLWRHYPRWQRALLAPIKGFLLKSAAEGAATQTYVATATELASTSGQCFEDSNPIVPPPQVRDLKLAQRLWDVSEQLLAAHLV
jgi:NAD(P)-dependent dehydrogenase (short-subunit alcohol dehydrogenase family)